MAKVSVIIATFNLGRYICASVESVLGQAFKDLEVVIIDDGSQDDTRDVLKKFGNQIRYIYQDNQGISGARNKGIREARGEYIAFLDADDIWLQGKLKLQVEALDSHPEVAMVFTDSEEFSDEEVLRASSRPTQNPGSDRQSLAYRMYSAIFNDGAQIKGYFYKDLLLGDPVRLSTLMLRKDILESVGLFDNALTINQDYDLCIRVARKYHLMYINKVTARYRIRPSSVSGGWGHREFLYKEHDAHVLRKHLKDCPAEYRSLLKKRIYENYKVVTWNFFRLLDRKNVRKYSLLSLLYNKSRIKPYFYFLSTFLPAGLIRSLRRLSPGTHEDN